MNSRNIAFEYLYVKHFFVFVLLLATLHNHVYGQIKIEGKITTKSKVPIVGVNVIISSKNQNNIIAYTTSDKNGYYELNCQIAADSLQITLNSLSYEKIVRALPAKSQTLNFELKEQAISLKEVSVKAPPIVESGDTLNYLVSAFTSKNDRVIEDVLKKLPGIDVSESGRISYQGKPINKFYIENMDLLQGRYAIATKNISVKDVASVEVYENHQPIKALSETQSSDQAAINLKLREDAKGIVSLMAQVGLGAALDPASFLWDNELILLFFSKKWQNITTYKGNNSGNDVTQEFISFYSDAEALVYEGRFLSVLAPNPPPINKERYLFNNTHAVSTNVLHAFKNDYQLTANVVCYNDKQTKESYAASTYYLSSDSCLIVEELLNSKSTVNHAAATITLEANKEKFYLKNALNLNASWMNHTGISEAMDTMIHQKLKTNLYNVSNRLELIKNFSGEKSMRFYSFNGYAQTPQNLLIKPALYEEIINNGQPYEKLNQQTTFKDFSSKTSFSFFITKPKFTQSYWGGFDATVQSLNSLLEPLQDNGMPASLAPDSLQNDLLWQQYKIYIQPSYTYRPWRKLHLELLLPLSYNLLLISDKIPDNRKPIHRVLFNPSLTVLYDITQKWSFKTNYSFYNYLGSIQDSYTGYIMRNYRSYNRNDGQLADNKSHACFLRVSYRNAMRALFANVDLFYEHLTSNMIRDNAYSGILQMQNNIRKSVASHTYGVGGTISKNVYSWRTTFSVSGNFYDMSSSQMVQGELIDFRYINYGLKPRIESQISSWAGLSYTLLWNGSKNVIKKSNNSSIHSIANYVKVYFYPVKGLEILAAYEHYYNNTISKEKNKHFVDLGISYRWKWADISLIWSNIINTHQYNTVSYIDLNEFVNIYEIRPSQILLKVKFKII